MDNHIIYLPNWVTFEMKEGIINNYVKRTGVLSCEFVKKTLKELPGTNDDEILALIIVVILLLLF